MSFLLDTNVLSELTRPGCEPRVLQWLGSLDEDETFISVMSVAEIRQGIEFLPRGRCQSGNKAWFERTRRLSFDL